MRRAALALLLCLVPVCGALARDGVLRVAVTTSTENSGLAAHLEAAAETALGLDLQFIVVGTGQALRIGERGDVDALLVHSPSAERAFVAAGHAPFRLEIMRNSYVLVGPPEDPAGVASAVDAADAFGRIAASEAPFASRGDDSGTHRRELSLWRANGRDADTFGARWYRAAGRAQGGTLNLANALGAYALTDTATWETHANRARLVVLHRGAGDELRNIYGYLPVSSSPAERDARRFGAWLTGPSGRDAISSFAPTGFPLFQPLGTGPAGEAATGTATRPHVRSN